MEDYQKIIGERIRTYRKAAGMSQNDLAQKVGMHYAYIGQVERGEKNMTIKTLCKISEALGIPPENLISGVGGVQMNRRKKRRKTFPRRSCGLFGRIRMRCWRSLGRSEGLKII